MLISRLLVLHAELTAASSPSPLAGRAKGAASSAIGGAVKGAHDAVNNAVASHKDAIPLAVAGVVLFITAGIIRRIVKLAILVALGGTAALAFAGYRAGWFAH